MKVIICGANQIGYNIASYLAAEENDIIIIDESPELIGYVQETLDVQAVIGQGSCPSLLEELAGDDTNILIAVMPSDEHNIIACQIGQSLLKIPVKIAHIRNQSYLNSKWLDQEVHNFPIDYIISPERQVARVILSNLKIPGVMEVVHLENSESIALFLHFDEHSPMNNIPLQQIGEQFSGLPFRVLGIFRNEDFVIPGAQDYLMSGDDAYVLVEREKLSRFLAVFGIKSEPLEKIIISGGGSVGLYLAQGILREMPDVSLKIIENNKDRARFLAETLEDVVVLHGNVIDLNVLKEAKVSQSDMMVSVTNDDAANILSSLLGKNLGVPRVTTLVSNMMYPKFLPSLGVDSILNPGFITISTILNHIRRGSIRTAHVLQGEVGEIFEASVPSDSKLIGEKFGLLNVHEKSIVGSVIRNESFYIPRSDEFIEENDHLILLVSNTYIGRIEKMLRSRND
ncbi:Trk system potassium transporter TrkA [Alphaproteobacteria bacterium]|nr:Trk system potassium transporter TrkA [Alphaproteobacteria bacterium]